MDRAAQAAVVGDFRSPKDGTGIEPRITVKCAETF